MLIEGQTANNYSFFAGPRGGLSLILDAQQNEYTQGLPHSEAPAGFRIRIHDQDDDSALMLHSGTLIPSGMESNLAITHEQVYS